mgnify:CR=1 FL=1
MGYVTPKEACNYYGVTHPSLRRWASSDKIKYIRTPGGDFRYWIDENDNSREPNLIRTEIIYARVANAKYQNDLQCQIEYLSQKYPNAIIEKEIGSGLDFNRKGIQNILNLILSGQVNTIIITHKDRICRFGYEFFEWFCKKYNTTIIIDHKDLNLDFSNEELVEDFFTIANFFSNKLYGNKKFKVKNHNSLTDILCDC